MLLLSAMSPYELKAWATLEKAVSGLKPLTTIWVGGPGPMEVAGSYGYGFKLYGVCRNLALGRWKSTLM